MTRRTSRIAAMAVRWIGRRARVAARLRRRSANLGDCVLAVLIVGAGIVALSPLTGIAAARETMVARRSRRASIAEAEQTHSEIWARQARRNALAREDPVAAWRYRSPFSP